jgi:SAM-dependent methyltransferase
MNREDIVPAETGPVKYNLGCGRDYKEGFVNCDVLAHVKADKHFDLETFPYPIDDATADEVFMDNVLEHLDDVPRTMTELHRVLKPGGVAKIIVPYGKSDWALQDPTHRHFFTETSMSYFAEGADYNYYTETRFKVLQAVLFTDNETGRQRLRNIIPFRGVLRFFLTNMYDCIYFELQKG